MSAFASVPDPLDDVQSGLDDLQLESPSEVREPTKPEVQKVRGQLTVSGISKAVPFFADKAEAQASFKDCFSDLFIDSSREEHSLMLCGSLAALAAGKLKGQRNCFVGLGPRGIGKSQFFIALGDWFTRIGDSNCAFLYKQMGVTDECSPFCTSTTSVCKIIHFLALELKWDNVPAEPWRDSTKCLDWLLDNNKKVFLVLDEFDQAYKEKNTEGLLSDLAEVGGDAGKRPLVIALLGSSSRLRSLCFCEGDYNEMASAGFAGYAGAPNLNSTKFLPLSFSSITTVESTKHALSSLGFHPPESFNFAGLCKVTRGEVRSFEDIYNEMKSGRLFTKSRRSSAWDESINKRILSTLWQGTQRSIQEHRLTLNRLSNVMNLAVEFTPELQMQLSCPKDCFVGAGIASGQLYQCADESVIAFDGGDVSFLHPVDVESCILLFGKDPRTDGRLTLAEEVSLLNANNASTDEVNERLVCESLCERGIHVEGLGHLTFAPDSPTSPVCCHGVTHKWTKADGMTFTKTSNYGVDLLSNMYVGIYNPGSRTMESPAHLRKEFPDGLGGDLIAVYRVNGAENVRFVVVRVQIKLGTSERTNADDGARTPITKMMDHEQLIIEALGATAEQVIFVRVLWTSQRTKATNDDAQRIIVIKSGDMMNYWIEPVQAFVRERRLIAYGFQA